MKDTVKEIVLSIKANFEDLNFPYCLIDVNGAMSRMNENAYYLCEQWGVDDTEARDAIYVAVKEWITIKQNLCQHKWEEYVVPLDPHNHWHDIEQAGYCVKCGYDTHGKYFERSGNI